MPIRKLHADMPLLARLKTFHFHFVLLVLFFILRGYSEHIGLIPLTDLLILFLTTSVSGLILFYIFKKIVHSRNKAGILTTIGLLFYLFYGAIKDGLKPGILHPVSRHSILFPMMLIILVALTLYFKKTAKEFPRLSLFINCLLLLYLVIDTGTIVFRSLTKTEQPTEIVNFSRCDTCNKPDIYLIVLDEYSGHRILQNYFHYNNESFENALKQKGFFVASNPSSNYSATPVSIASLFSMDYLPIFHRKINADDYTRSEKIVEKSVVMQFLRDHGYRFMNHSMFDLAGQPGPFKTDLLPLRLKLITAKTLWNSINRDARRHIREQDSPKLNWLLNMLPDDYKHGNQRLLRLTQEAIRQKATEPRFIYTHLMMPHFPYLYDSTGKRTGINFYKKGMPVKQKEAAYIQYLVYANKLMLELTAGILTQTQGEAIIILMSDHGYRDKPGEKLCSDVNNNFAAVYLPGKNYQLFYDSISNVNLFRSVFNTTFQQQFAQLPDSCIF